MLSLRKAVCQNARSSFQSLFPLRLESLATNALFVTLIMFVRCKTKRRKFYNITFCSVLSLWNISGVFISEIKAMLMKKVGN